MASYTEVPTQNTGDSWTATEHNVYLKDNMESGYPALVTTKGDLVVATGSKAGERLAAGSNGQQLESNSSESGGRKWVNPGLVPVGGIVIWSGSTGTIPSGWQLCNGTNSTPDLRDEFIVGAGDEYALDASGGAANINLQHSHTLTSPSGSGGDHDHVSVIGYTNETGAHQHSIPSVTTAGSPNAITGTTGSGSTVAVDNHTHTAPGGNTANDGAHQHTYGEQDTGAHTHVVGDASTSNAGSTSQDIRPPYYALAYIMRMS